MKKIITIFVSLLMLVSLLSACANEDKTNGTNTNDFEKVTVVTTIPPVYDWVREIIGDKVENVDVTMLLDNGVDLHSYQPSADDIVKVSNCDMFIYVGGESDTWVDDVLKQATNKEMVVVELMEVLGEDAKEEEVVEGMEADHGHNHGEHDEDAEHGEHGEHDEDVEHDESDEHEEHDEGGEHGHTEKIYDEHIWLSLKNAKILCQTIADKISMVEPSNKGIYNANVKSYIEKLSKLDEEYEDIVAKAKRDTLLFGDRFPFRYLVDDYDLKYFAAFVGCSAETEASFETIAFLANKVDELGVSCVLTIEGANHKIAETIVGNTETNNQDILVMDSLQATTAADMKNGKTYISAMEQNLEVLKDALK